MNEHYKIFKRPDGLSDALKLPDGRIFLEQTNTIDGKTLNIVRDKNEQLTGTSFHPLMMYSRIAVDGNPEDDCLGVYSIDVEEAAAILGISVAECTREEWTNRRGEVLTFLKAERRLNEYRASQGEKK